MAILHANNVLTNVREFLNSVTLMKLFLVITIDPGLMWFLVELFKRRVIHMKTQLDS